MTPEFLPAEFESVANVLGARTTATGAECGAGVIGRPTGAPTVPRVPLFTPPVPIAVRCAAYVSVVPTGTTGDRPVGVTPAAASAEIVGSPRCANVATGTETVFIVAGDIGTPRGPARITPFDALPANTTCPGPLGPVLILPGFTGVAGLGVHPT